MSEKTTGTIILPTGEEESVPTIILDAEDAHVLRQYKKFLLKYGLAEAVRCKHCFETLGQSMSGMEAHVTDHEILFRCRHRMLYHRGLAH